MLLSLCAGGLALSALLVPGGSKARPAETFARCARGDYWISAADSWWRTHGGAMVVGVGVFTEYLSAPCRVTRRVRVGIRLNGVRLRGVSGNPMVTKIGGELKQWDEFVHTWAWENWCGPRRHRATVTIAGLGKTYRYRLRKLPRCRNPRAPSRLVSLKTRRDARSFPPEPGFETPAYFVPPSVPPIPSPSLIRVQNRWQVSDGRSVMDVYAGEEGDDPARGMFFIVRTYLPFGFQDWTAVMVPGRTRAVKITEAPLGKAVETSAQRARLGFSSKSGATGTFDLVGLRVMVSGG